MAVVDKVRSVNHTATETRRDQGGGWSSWYVRLAVGIDFLCMLVAGTFALAIRFRGITSAYTLPYFAMTASLPFLWVITLTLCRAYEPRLIGVGSEEFRRVLQSGFVLTATHMPGAYEDFTRLVVPELQRRGLFHREYVGTTLRENLGLPRPARGAWRTP